MESVARVPTGILPQLWCVRPLIMSHAFVESINSDRIGSCFISAIICVPLILLIVCRSMIYGLC